MTDTARTAALPVLPDPASAPHDGRRDALVALLLAAALLLLEWSGADAALSTLWGDAQGFALRDRWWARVLLHDGGRWLSGVLLAGLLLAALRAPQAAPVQPPRRERLFWWGVCGLCMLGVSAVKFLSPSACPWDLQDFGGPMAWVSHWDFGRWGAAGRGRCFPSGHASAGFAFVSQYFLWRPYQPRRAHRWLVVGCALGLAFGVAQVLRGAHFASHVGWTAWLCWVLCALASAAARARR